MLTALCLAVVFGVNSADLLRIRRDVITGGPTSLSGVVGSLDQAVSASSGSLHVRDVSEMSVPDKDGMPGAVGKQQQGAPAKDVNGNPLAGNLAVPTTIQVPTGESTGFNSRGPGRYIGFTFQQVPTIQQAPIVGIPLQTIQQYYNPLLAGSLATSTTAAPIPSFEATAYYPLVWRFPYSNVQLPAYTTTGHYAYTAYPVKYYGSLPSQVTDAVDEKVAGGLRW